MLLCVPLKVKAFDVNYCPKTKFTKVIISQVSVCPQGGLPNCMLGYHPPGTRGRHPPGQTPPSGQTPPGQTAPGPETDTPPPPGQTPLGKHAPSGQTTPLGRHPLHSACWDTVNKRAVRIPLECILVNTERMRQYHLTV